jgi:uncharacterized protein (TIGR00369 family)
VEFQVLIPFVEHLGFQLQRWDNGEAEITFDPKDEHLNSFLVVHGGASMTLLDVVMAHAARSVNKDMGVVTIEMKTSFMQAAKGPLRSTGKLLHRTATMAFTEGQVWDAKGRLCCHASGTFKYVNRLPVGDKTIHGLNAPSGISTD